MSNIFVCDGTSCKSRRADIWGDCDLRHGVPPQPAWTPSDAKLGAAKKKRDGKKGSLELEQGGKFGGKFAKWEKLHFVVRGDKLLVFANVLENEDQKRMEILTTDCAMRLPKTARKGRPHAAPL